MSIYSKTEQGWLPVVGGWSQQTPPAPIIANKEGGMVVQFASGGSGSAGPTLVYGATITPNDNGETVVVDQVNLDVAVQGAAQFTEYVVSVYGVNIAGNGEAAYTLPFQLNYNSASGGIETVVDDYNGTGEQWMVHKFEASGTLSVASAPALFRYLVVGAGGSGGGKPSPQGGGGGCGGVVDTVGLLSVGDIAITVGVGQNFSQEGEADPSAIDGVVVAGGGFQGGSGYSGGGGNSGSPLSTTGANGASNQTCGGGAGASANGGGVNGGFGVTTTIGGSVSQDFAGGGGGGNRGKGTGAGASGGGNARNPNGTNGTRAGSGGGGSDYDGYGGSGFRGEVVVAYKIGMSTNAQIRLAKEQRSALADGREAGYGEGFTEGRAAATVDTLEAMRLAEEAQ